MYLFLKQYKCNDNRVETGFNSLKKNKDSDMKYILIAFLMFGFTSVFSQENQRYINVNGTSELVRAADQLNYTITIRNTDQSVEQCKIINDKNLEDLLTILNMAGIDKKDLDISPVRLGKNYEFGSERQQIQKGYFAEVEISFLLKDLSKYYQLTNELASGNSFEITNSSYTISDYEIQHKIAYEEAITAAKEKAKYMADRLGLKLGDVLEIDENNYWQNYGSPVNTLTIDNSQELNNQGKVVIRRSVRVKFELIN